LIRGDFALQIFEELFERLSFIGLDKMIDQFHGADGAGKVVVQIDCQFFFLAHVPIAFYPLSFVRTLTRQFQTHNAIQGRFEGGHCAAQLLALSSQWSHVDRQSVTIDIQGDPLTGSIQAVSHWNANWAWHANLFLEEQCLEEQWQLMGALEALNGMLLFGLTTAFLFAMIQKVWPKLRRVLRRSPAPESVRCQFQ
jgi:hypothetical protein